MWGNIGLKDVTGLVGAAIQNVQKMSKDLESQLDAAVGADTDTPISPGRIEHDSASQNVVFSHHSEDNFILPANDAKLIFISKTSDDKGALSNRTKSIPNHSGKRPMGKKTSRSVVVEKDENVTANILHSLSVGHVSIDPVLSTNSDPLSPPMTVKKKVDIPSNDDHITVPLEDEAGKSSTTIFDDKHLSDETSANVDYSGDNHELKNIAVENISERTEGKKEENVTEGSIEMESSDQIFLRLRSEIHRLRSENSSKTSQIDSLQRQIEQQLEEEKVKWTNQLYQLQEKSETEISCIQTQHASVVKDYKRKLKAALLNNKKKVGEEASPQVEASAVAVCEASTATDALEMAIPRADVAVNTDPVDTGDHLVNETALNLAEYTVRITELETLVTALRLSVEEERAKGEGLAKVHVEWTESMDRLRAESRGQVEALEKQLSDHVQSSRESKCRLEEVIRDRERALEGVTEKMGELTRQLEETQRRAEDLAAEVKEKDGRLRQAQSMAVNESELKKQLGKLLESVKEKDEKLVGFEQEGQALAKKQGELEKSIRKSRSELKEKESEIVKLKEQKEQLVKTIEEMQEAMRRNEGEVHNSAKSLAAIQAVSQASADRLAKLEGEIHSKNDEVAVAKRALESSWAEINELKRALAEARADRDECKRRLTEGSSRVSETETLRRDVEQREAVLKATNAQLQESLQRQMQESASREDRLRDELHDMRRRWQEAVTGRESLSAEVSGATAPLLRQIASLQDLLRVRSEQWQGQESALSERVMRAEGAAEAMEHRRRLAEEHLGELKQQLSSSSARFLELQEQHLSLQSTYERLRRSEKELQLRLSEVEEGLRSESQQRQSLQSSLRELEARHRMELHEARQAADASVRQADIKTSQWKMELETLKAELESERRKKRSAGRSGQSALTSDLAPPETGDTSSATARGYSSTAIAESLSSKCGGGPPESPHPVPAVSCGCTLSPLITPRCI